MIIILQVDRLRSRVNEKLTDGDFHSAVQVLSSDDTLATYKEDVLQGLKLKNPAAPSGLRKATPLKDGRLYIVMKCFDNYIIFFSFRGSSGGIDGLRPIHLVF